MPRSQKIGLGGKVIGSIRIDFNQRFQVANVVIEGGGDCVPMSAIRDSMTIINNAILQARGRRKRSGVVLRREAGIRAKEEENARLIKERKDKREEAKKQALEDAEALLQAEKEKKNPDPPPTPPAPEKKEEKVVTPPLILKPPVKPEEKKVTPPAKPAVKLVAPITPNKGDK